MKNRMLKTMLQLFAEGAEPGGEGGDGGAAVEMSHSLLMTSSKGMEIRQNLTRVQEAVDTV